MLSMDRNEIIVRLLIVQKYTLTWVKFLNSWSIRLLSDRRAARWSYCELILLCWIYIESLKKCIAGSFLLYYIVGSHHAWPCGSCCKHFFLSVVPRSACLLRKCPEVDSRGIYRNFYIFCHLRWIFYFLSGFCECCWLVLLDKMPFYHLIVALTSK